MIDETQHYLQIARMGAQINSLQQEVNRLMSRSNELLMMVDLAEELIDKLNNWSDSIISSNAETTQKGEYQMAKVAKKAKAKKAKK